MSLRILFAIHGPPDPGTAVYLTVKRRADHLNALGHRVDIMTPADLRFGTWSRLQPLLLPVGLAMRDLDHYDVVVFHSHLAWAHGLRRMVTAAQRPATVVAFHGLEPLYHEALAAELARTGERLSPQFALLHRGVVPHLLAFASRRADRVFCLNSRERNFIMDRGWTTADKVRVVPNGVERKLFLERQSYRPRATRLLFVGQWLRAKGVRYLARAFEGLAASNAELELTCVGTGVDVEQVRRDFSSAVRGRVRVRPRVDRCGLLEELSRADIFVFPSLSEGFSGALLEAMAAALPVVATPVGGAPDLLIDGRNARLVPSADESALIAGVSALLDEPAARRQLGSAAQATAERYEWDVVNAQFADELVDAVESHDE
jgi:glycosyltransferase involved in cell wall biosynthesis